MGKNSGILSNLFLIGMALVAVGFILPMFQGLGGTVNGFDFVNLDNLGATTIGALLIFIGAVVGVVFCFAPSGNADMIKFIALVATIAGGIIIIITFNKSWLSKTVGKGFWKHATYGTYMILVGWIAALVGRFKG
ncbi:MAG: hypothetical protein PQJ59_12780 [Spirochaetales bacterium]|nr:hypothetical protein [Spirochaetales bacterium]